MSEIIAEKVTLYRVMEETDKQEGRRGSRVVGYTRTRVEALELAKDKGVMGFPTEVTEHDFLKLTGLSSRWSACGSIPSVCYVLADNVIPAGSLLGVSLEELAAVRAAAKAKLSENELEALGLA